MNVRSKHVVLSGNHVILSGSEGSAARSSSESVPGARGAGPHSHFAPLVLDPSLALRMTSARALAFWPIQLPFPRIRLLALLEIFTS
jgi:hypothetical protein